MTRIEHPIRRLRTARDMTAEQLAVKAGISIATVYRAERGEHRPSRLALRAIADALDVQPGDLVPSDDHGPERDSATTGRGKTVRDDDPTAKSSAVPAHTGV